MADIENQQQEPALCAKRKSDLACLDQGNSPNKTLKLQSFTSSAPEGESGHKDEARNGSEIHIRESSTDEKTVDNSSEKPEETAGLKGKEAVNDDVGERGEGNEEEKEVEDEDEDEDEEAVKVDRKGKGIMRDDKGKGKLIEEDEDEGDSDDDDDDSGDGGNESDGESDLSDDPLAEVDLDNILPSRTRRRAVQPGVYISNELGPGDDDDSSDDSDA